MPDNDIDPVGERLLSVVIARQTADGQPAPYAYAAGFLASTIGRIAVQLERALTRHAADMRRDIRQILADLNEAAAAPQ